MKICKKYPMLGSSGDSEKLSLTIKSIGVWLIPAIIAIGKSFDLPIVEADLTLFINTLAIVSGGIMTLYGVSRKVYYYIFK